MSICAIEACPCMEPCPMQSAFRVIGGKWKMKIICSLYYNGSLRYGELKSMVVGIGPTMLANSLRELEEDGIVSRVVTETMPVRVDYTLTEKAHSLGPIIISLRDWMVENDTISYREIAE